MNKFIQFIHQVSCLFLFFIYVVMTDLCGTYEHLILFSIRNPIFMLHVRWSGAGMAQRLCNGLPCDGLVFDSR